MAEDMDVHAAAAALGAARAAELDVVADTRPNPWWVWPSLALAELLFLASFDITGSTAWVALSSALYAAAIGVFVGALHRHRGTQPRLARLPATLRRQLVVAMVVGALVTGLLVLGAVLLLDGPPRFTVAGLLIAAATLVGGRFADRRYIAEAQRLRNEAAA